MSYDDRFNLVAGRGVDPSDDAGFGLVWKIRQNMFIRFHQLSVRGECVVCAGCHRQEFISSSSPQHVSTTEWRRFVRRESVKGTHPCHFRSDYTD